MKKCNTCKEFLNLKCFTKSKYYKSGYESKCKKCRNEARKKYSIVCETCETTFRTARRQSKYCSRKCQGAVRIRRVEVNCTHCGKSKEVIPALAKLRSQHYCGQDCRTEHLKVIMRGELNPNYDRIAIPCDGCGIEIKIHPYRFKNLKHHFCSHVCYKNNIGQYYTRENNSFWNPNLTDEERIRGRRYPEYNEWRTSVFKRDKYTCQCCGDNNGGNLEAHHIYNYSEHDDMKLDTANGITWCEFCHKRFHDEYGYTNNDFFQFEEYMNKYAKTLIPQ